MADEYSPREKAASPALSCSLTPCALAYAAPVTIGARSNSGSGIVCFRAAPSAFKAPQLGLQSQRLPAKSSTASSISIVTGAGCSLALSSQSDPPDLKDLTVHASRGVQLVCFDCEADCERAHHPMAPAPRSSASPRRRSRSPDSPRGERHGSGRYKGGGSSRSPPRRRSPSPPRRERSSPRRHRDDSPPPRSRRSRSRSRSPGRHQPRRPSPEYRKYERCVVHEARSGRVRGRAGGTSAALTCTHTRHAAALFAAKEPTSHTPLAQLQPRRTVAARVPDPGARRNHSACGAERLTRTAHAAARRPLPPPPPRHDRDRELMPPPPPRPAYYDEPRGGGGGPPPWAGGGFGGGGGYGRHGGGYGGQVDPTDGIQAENFQE